MYGPTLKSYTKKGTFTNKERWDMPLPEKSDIMKSVLKTLISISRRKTEDLMKRLEPQYGFLKHVQINDDFYTEGSGDVISVMSDINTVSPTELGKALHSIIDSMNRSLGANAGHFFIKEIRNNLSDEDLSIMRDMGVDLSLMQLESEIIRLEREIAERKKQS